MPFYLHQVSYTPEALTRLIADPHDRFEAVRVPIEKLGGKIKESYFAFGQHDAVLITEMPDNISACFGLRCWRRLAQLPEHSAYDQHGSASGDAQSRYMRVQTNHSQRRRRTLSLQLPAT
jgi:hypothetical protein